MTDDSNLVKPSSCVGVVFGAEHEVYADTGFDVIRNKHSEGALCVQHNQLWPGQRPSTDSDRVPRPLTKPSRS